MLLIRIRRNMQISNIGFWESWRRSQSINRKKVWVQMGGALSGLLPWQQTLRSIEGEEGLWSMGLYRHPTVASVLSYRNQIISPSLWCYCRIKWECWCVPRQVWSWREGLLCFPQILDLPEHTSLCSYRGIYSWAFNVLWPRQQQWWVTRNVRSQQILHNAIQTSQNTLMIVCSLQNLWGSEAMIPL